MPESKSSKPKGCYNCMKRRIICDRTEPHCNKCHKKNLTCPGYGVRYRFNDGIASRGQFKGMKQPTSGDQIKELQNEGGNGTVGTPPKSLVWINDKTTVSQDVEIEMVGPVIRDTSMTTSPMVGDFVDKTFEAFDLTASTDMESGSALFIFEPLEFLDAKTRFLFSHFSTYVSPVMILFDGETNGYRHEILPFGVCDEVVQRSICVAAALHLAPKMPELRIPAEAGRTAIIRKLKENADGGGPSDVFGETTWVTILLLIVTDLVTGHEDVLILYRMLKSYLNGRSRAANTPLTKFLMYQSQVIEFFASSVLSEDDGVQRLTQEAQPLVNIIEKEYDTPASASVVVLLYNEAYRQARNIYLFRAEARSGVVDEVRMTQLVEQLRFMLLELDPTTEGAHALVWPYFIAAAESRDEANRQFFYARLEHIWESTGYNNVKVALVELRKIWTKQRFQRWTSIIPEIATVIM